MNHILKVEFYDEFKCTADRCSFTCCEGWEIIVDTDTYNKWKSNTKQSGYLCKNVKIKKGSKGTEAYIKMGPNSCCPFLDEKGLCNIVITCGEDYLSKTCKVFPRQENNYGILKEYSLSCACPAVIDIINDVNGKVQFPFDGDESIWDNIPLEYKIRDAMLTIMQNSKFSFKDRLLLTFNMLLIMKKELVTTNELVIKNELIATNDKDTSSELETISELGSKKNLDIVINIIRNHQDESYLLSLADIWSGTRIDNVDSYIERKELFLDIVENYRNEKNFSYYLKDISDLVEMLDIRKSQILWNDFNIVYGEFENLIENCIVSKIFSNCINGDIDEMIMSFQIVITEYVMVKYSAFLRWLLNDKKEIDYNDIRDYIVMYSRIIGYNTDGIIEFWEDSFDGAVWEFGYMLLLIK